MDLIFLSPRLENEFLAAGLASLRCAQWPAHLWTIQGRPYKDGAGGPSAILPTNYKMWLQITGSLGNTKGSF